MACSTGASARPKMMVPAMIEPGLISLLQREPRADRQHQRLAEQAQGLGQRRQPAEPVGRHDLPGQSVTIGLLPARAVGGGHAHRRDRLGIALAGFGEFDAGVGGLVGFGQGRAASGLAEPGEPEQHQRAEGGGEAEHPVDHEDDEQVDRRPRCVEEGDGTRAGEELAQVVELAQCRHAGALRGDVAAERSLEDAVADALVDFDADTDHDARADQLEQADDAVDQRGHDGQRDERRHRPRGHDAIVDLQHEQRAGEHQDVDEEAEHAGGVERAATGVDGGSDLAAADAGAFVGEGVGGAGGGGSCGAGRCDGRRRRVAFARQERRQASANAGRQMPELGGGGVGGYRGGGGRGGGCGGRRRSCVAGDFDGATAAGFCPSGRTLMPGPGSRNSASSRGLVAAARSRAGGSETGREVTTRPATRSTPGCRPRIRGWDGGGPFLGHPLSADLRARR